MFCITARAACARRSPRRIRASMRVRRAATSENSAATNRAFATTSSATVARRSPREYSAVTGIGQESSGLVARPPSPPICFRLMTQVLPLDVQCAHKAPARHESARRMRAALLLAIGVTVAEALGGWFAHSLALLADAGHMLADVGALGLAVFVARVAQRPATPQRSYGLVRLEILAALVNGAALVAIAVGIGVEALRRLESPSAVHGAL